MSIIAIAGRMGSGKNTVGDIIEKLCLTNNGPKFEQKSFAGKLKQIASLLTGIPVEDFEDQEFKKSYLGAEWGTVESNPLNSIPVFENIKFNHLMSVRELLQKLGTEAMRDGLHENVWVNALFADYANRDSNKEELIKISKEYGNEVINDDWSVLSIKDIKDRLPDYLYKQKSNWIITDMRFPNEMEAVKERKGITIRVVRPVEKSKTTARLHPSETSLDKAKFDYEIINDAGILELIKKVRQILITEKII